VRIRTKTTGLKRWERKLRRYPDHAPKAIQRALYQEAEFSMTDAKELVPVLTSALKNSGFVDPPGSVNASTRKISVELGFGGVAGKGNAGSSNAVDVGYAVFVHEDCNAHHEVGQCKYLEIPVRAAMKTIPMSIEREMDRLHRSMRRS